MSLRKRGEAAREHAALRTLLAHGAWVSRFLGRLRTLHEASCETLESGDAPGDAAGLGASVGGLRGLRRRVQVRSLHRH